MTGLSHLVLFTHFHPLKSTVTKKRKNAKLTVDSNAIGGKEANQMDTYRKSEKSKVMLDKN